MKTVIKSLALTLIALVGMTAESMAQKISAAAVVDQHYAAQTANYKFMMIALAAVYAVYVMVQSRRKRELNRFMGKI